MANAFYDSARHDYPAGADPWISGTVKATLVNAGYTYNSGHSNLAALGANILSGITDQTLAGKTISGGGTVAANSVTFAGLTAAQTLKAIVLYQDLGGGTTRLIAYFDSGTGFPLTTTGADVTVDWNATAVNGTVFNVV